MKGSDIKVYLVENGLKQAHIAKKAGIPEPIFCMMLNDKGIERYKATLELSVAIATMNQFQKQKEEILRREKEREERIKAAEEKEEPSGRTVPVIPAVPTKEPKEESAASAPAGNTVRYEVIADLFQIAQLESAMREYGIKFRRV